MIDLVAAGKWAVGALVAFGAWTYQKLDARVEKLEDRSVTKEDFENLRSEVRGDVRGLYGKVDSLKDELLEVWKDR